MNNELTDKQQLIYDYIKKEIKNTNFPPSVREICKAVNLSSTSTVHAHLDSLEKKGYIRRSPSKSRSIEILENNFYDTYKEIAHVPIIGKVSAGLPILAVENIEDTFPIPISHLPNNNVFMLRITGDSMINAGILNKDLVLVRSQKTAVNGDIVVALLDDSATVKTFYKEDNTIRLQPENPAYEPIITTELTILGKVIGLYRSL